MDSTFRSDSQTESASVSSSVVDPSVPWYEWGKAALLATFALGIVFRLRLAGVSLPDWAMRGEWRQAHTHLGFFGAWIPLVWASGLTQGAPSARWRLFYFAVVLVAVGAFLVSGYNPVSRVGSGIVLAVWIRYALANWKSTRTWIISASILSSVLFLIMVVVQAKSFGVAASYPWVRGYLSVLVLGWALPVVRLRAGVSAGGVVEWIATVATAFFIATQLGYWAWGPVALAGSLLWAVKNQGLKAWTSAGGLSQAYLLAMALGLAVFSLGSGSRSHLVSLAMVHFFVLGPLLDTLLLFSLPARRVQALLAVVFAISMGVGGLHLLNGLLGVALLVWVGKLHQYIGTVQRDVLIVG